VWFAKFECSIGLILKHRIGWNLRNNTLLAVRENRGTDLA